MFFLTGVGRYLFRPMAEAVVFAMLASYLLSRTLVPTMAKYLLRGHHHGEDNPGWFDRGFARLHEATAASWPVRWIRRALFASVFLAPAWCRCC